MSVKRIMGIETEYGISCPANSLANPMFLSSLVVGSYSQEIYPDMRIKWDYDLENPLRDARGFDASRAEADPSLLTDEALVTNVVLTNGARFYVDHAHPEYSSPEVITPQEAVLWDKAGEHIINKAAKLASKSNADGEIFIYKNNTDNKGVSYGTHENYLVNRDVPFSHIARVLTTFFVSRQIFTGAGRLGVGTAERNLSFQISQRADFFETLIGLETTMRRPIINTRDEPHADPNKFRRLHVIIGDANISEVANLVKLGSTSLVLGMLEDKLFQNFDLDLEDPLQALRDVSRDPNLEQKIALKSGKELTAIEIQEEFLRQVTDWLDHNGVRDEETDQVLYWWDYILTHLKRDKFQLANCLDWIAKLKILNEIRDRDKLTWDDPMLQMVDLQYSDMNPDRGIAKLLERRGSLIQLNDPKKIENAVDIPPTTTRAWFRGQALRHFANRIAGASWDSVIFDVADDRPLVRIPTTDPYKGTKQQIGDIFEKNQDISSLIEHISRL
jgi:Pup amidohydrolase